MLKLRHFISSVVLIFAGAVLWREWLMCNQVTKNYRIKKRITVGLFIDGTAALFRGETKIRNKTNNGDQIFDTLWLEKQIFLVHGCYIKWKGVGIKDQVTTCLEMSLLGMW